MATRDSRWMFEDVVFWTFCCGFADSARCARWYNLATVDEEQSDGVSCPGLLAVRARLRTKSFSCDDSVKKARTHGRGSLYGMITGKYEYFC
jgi:hypothetical protein